MTDACDICGGTGRYPIFNIHGSERYSINCPECSGSGEAYVDETVEVFDFAPSTAAKVKDKEQMHEEARRWRDR